jgi:uncharacterized repeat protein (TIGR03987 family)
LQATIYFKILGGKNMLIYAVVFMNLALLFYTVGVWGEKIEGKLKPWHLTLFYIGLVCDTKGTLIMKEIAKSSAYASPFHSITGLTAIVLMTIHALWATYVLIKNDKIMLEKFHKFSIAVWAMWLIPFLSGAISHII